MPGSPRAAFTPSAFTSLKTTPEMVDRSVRGPSGSARQARGFPLRRQMRIDMAPFGRPEVSGPPPARAPPREGYQQLGGWDNKNLDVTMRYRASVVPTSIPMLGHGDRWS